MTHWIDGSNIYGSEEEQINALRLRRGGLLKVSAGNMLPFAEGEAGECMATLRGARCFMAGMIFFSSNTEL